MSLNDSAPERLHQSLHPALDGSVDQAEAVRLADLHSYGLLDTPPEPQFDRIVALARVLFDTPIAAISLVDADRQWFKAQEGLDAAETAREISFCSHAMAQGDVFVVSDASIDPRFAEFANVTGEPNIRFYAGAPLRSAAGQSLGAVCVISSDPREDFSIADRKKLSILANIVGNEMELKRQLQHANKALYEQDLAVRETHYQLKNTIEFANLMAEVQAGDMPTRKLGTIAMAAWKQYTEAGAILASSIKSLRARMGAAEYTALIADMPGFAL